MIAPELVRRLVLDMIAELPEAIRSELMSVRVVVLEAPTALLLSEGVEPAEEGAYIVRGEDPMPMGDGFTDDPQDRAIYLFARNLTRERVRSVLLHEVAHACGLNEEEVSDLEAAS